MPGLNKCTYEPLVLVMIRYWISRWLPSPNIVFILILFKDITL